MPGLVLFVLAAAELLVGVDFAIVNVAVPSIGEDLGFTPEGLPWVLTGLLLPFGGFLLVTGRAADLFGRKKVLVAGLGLLCAASLAAGLAVTPGMLIAARAGQGIASAMIAPAALSLITTSYREGPERDRALGVAGAVLPIGFVVGLVLSGLLTAVSWRLTMLVNVPVGLLVLTLAVAVVAESRDRGEKPYRDGASGPIQGKLDLPGAVAGTAALTVLIYGISGAETAGWDSPRTLTSLAGSVMLGATFVAIEARAAAPLAPLWVLARRSVWAANLAGLVTFAGAVGLIFTLTLYVQQVWGYGPLPAGLAFVVMGLASILAGRLAPRLISRSSARATLVTALVIQAAGTLALTGLTTTAGSWAVFLAGTAVTGYGHITSVVAFRSLAASGLPDGEQGLAAGLATVSQQVGAALGVAFFVAVVALPRPSTEHGQPDQAEATTSGTRPNPGSLTWVHERGDGRVGPLPATGLVADVPHDQPAVGHHHHRSGQPDHHVDRQQVDQGHPDEGLSEPA